MRNASTLIALFLLSSILFSCLSEEEKIARQERIIAEELAAKEKEDQRLKELAAQKIKQDSLDALHEEQERKEQAIYDKYINNRLQSGSTPYAHLYGYNSKCNHWGCSQVKVTTPSSSDVLVLIKRNSKVVKHAYIRASKTYTFEMPNGTYQPFFYYGKGWNPNKIMKETSEGVLKGGFISNELFSKDNPQELNNNILEYVLILQQSGNFSTKPSSREEAF